MPTRSRTTTTGRSDTRTAGDAAREATVTLQGAAQDATDNASDLGEQTVHAGRQTGSTAGRSLRAPGSAVRAVVDDIGGAARRPDAVLTWVGLAGLAAFGVIEAPVAAVVGVGIAVAGGLRRART